jgi:hypothetical protein
VVVQHLDDSIVQDLFAPVILFDLDLCEGGLQVVGKGGVLRGARCRVVSCCLHPIHLQL